MRKSYKSIEDIVINQNPFAQLQLRYFLSILLFMFIAIYLVCILVAKIISSNFNYNNLILDYISYILFCIIFCFWLQRKNYKNQINLRNIVGKSSISYRLLIRLFILTIVLFCFSLGIILLTFSLISLTLPSLIESLIKYTHNNDSQLLSIPFYYQLLEIFAFVIIGPVAEEFIFRGVLLHIWAAKNRIGSSILLSSLVFGLFHLHPIKALLSGIFYTLLYIKYRSLFIPILVHSMNNAIAIVAPFFLKQVISDYNSMPTLDEITNMWKIGLLLTLVSAPFIARFIYQHWPSNSTLLPYFANTIKNSR